MTVLSDEPTQSEPRRSAQLARLMVLWRLRLDPATIAGIEPRKHVSQEQAAMLCAVSCTYYGRLERGQVNFNFSATFLDTVARVLRLTTSERTTLYLLTTGHEPKPRPFAPPKITRAVRADLLCQPWPAYIHDATFNVIACNDATRRWFPDLEQEPNVLRSVLTLPERRRQLIDWETVHVPHTVARLRAQMARLPGHDGLRKLAVEMLNTCPQARHHWVTDPRVWMHEDGARRRLYLPGATQPTVIEVISRTRMRNPDLTVVSLIPIGGNIPDNCLGYVNGELDASHLAL